MLSLVIEFWVKVNVNLWPLAEMPRNYYYHCEPCELLVLGQIFESDICVEC